MIQIEIRWIEEACLVISRGWWITEANRVSKFLHDLKSEHTDQGPRWSPRSSRNKTLGNDIYSWTVFRGPPESWEAFIHEHLL